MNGKTKASILLAILLLLATTVQAQHQPYKVHETKPVILNGPYLVAPTEDGVTVVWRTDTPCHSKVLYGIANELTSVVEPQEHGLTPIKRLHSVRLSGLEPGKMYGYKVVSTRVVKMKAYWPEKGLAVESPLCTFQVPDRKREKVGFSFITDSQYEDVRRLNANLELVDWEKADFLVHGGDTVDAVDNEEQFFEVFLEPISEALAHTTPLVFARGNHDMRGAYARAVYDYVPTGTGQFYYAFDYGPVHFVVLDTGEDKPDATNVYAGLNQMMSYRDQEFAWFSEHVRSSKRLREAAFRIILMHSPSWGWVNEENDKWTKAANDAGIDLVVAGHRHRLSVTRPGEKGNDYTILVVDQDQVGTIEATATEIQVTVTGEGKTVVESFTLPSQARQLSSY